MNHCNYNCSYCPDILKNGSIDLPNIIDCKAAVDQINSFAVTQGKRCYYYFTGGEVTQWPWLIDLVEHINFLPNSMNSLYELSQLTEKEFKSVIQRKDDLKVLTSSDISKLNQKKVKKKIQIEIEDSPRKSKAKFINEFTKNLLLEFQYQIETIEIRYDPKNSLMPAKTPKVIIVKSGSRNKTK